jgi:hypothetical protein
LRSGYPNALQDLAEVLRTLRHSPLVLPVSRYLAR